MRHILSTAAAVMTVIAICQSVSAQNLVVNGSFDGGATPAAGGQTNPDGWTKRAGESYVVADPGGNAKDGTNYVQFGNYVEIGQITPHTLVSGETIRMSMYARSFGAGTAAYDLRLYANNDPSNISDAGGLPDAFAYLFPVKNSENPAIAEVMTFYTRDVVVPSGAAGKKLGVYIGTQQGYYGYDAVSVSVVPEPASLGLLGLAGAAALGRRRRRRI
jgi:hypothetical protein